MSFPKREKNSAQTNVAVLRYPSSHYSPETDFIAIEEPLEIRIEFRDGDGRTHRAISITMRTPGNDFELAAGFLFTEGILAGPSQIREIKHCGKFPNVENTVRVSLDDQTEINLAKLERHFYTSSSCGVCGKTSLEALANNARPVPERTTPQISAKVIHQLLVKLRERQNVFEKTGGLHAAALFETDGKLLDVFEDVGRHNALDKLIGKHFLNNEIPMRNKIVFLSGRASFELIQKAAMAQAPIVCAVGAPSSLAVDAAKEFGITLLGFVRDSRFNIYSGEERIILEK